VAQSRSTPAPGAETPAGRRPWRPAPLEGVSASESVGDIQARLKAREIPQARFCWHCRKALHARTDTCPFCGESQR
jgi:hypothetical protein